MCTIITDKFAREVVILEPYENGNFSRFYKLKDTKQKFDTLQSAIRAAKKRLKGLKELLKMEKQL